MSKDDRSTSNEPGYEVIDEAKLKEVVNLLVEFAEEKKLHPRIMAVAMDFIVKKIKAHLEIEFLESHEGNELIH